MKRRLYDAAKMRMKVFSRDAGVCALCGCDTKKMSRIFQPLPDDEYRDAMRVMGFNPTQDWWQVDHIIQHADGGTDDIDNLRTLCVPCHKGITKAQATSRPQKRIGKDGAEFVNQTIAALADMNDAMRAEWMAGFTSQVARIVHVHRMIARAMPPTLFRRLGLSVKACNLLAEAKIHSLDELANKTRNQLLEMPEWGVTTVRECRRLLQKHGMAFVQPKNRQ